MARILVSGDGAPALISGLEEALGEDWVLIAGPHLEPGARVDVLALHERQGVAIITEGKEGFRAEEATEAFRRILDEHGVTRGLRGYLPVVAVAINPGWTRDPAGALRRAFLAEPVIGAAPGWTQRIIDLFPTRIEKPTERRREPVALHADRDDAWRVAREGKAAPEPAPRLGATLTGDEGFLPQRSIRDGGPSLWAAMALAICVVGVVLAAMALLSQGNAPPVSALDR